MNKNVELLNRLIELEGKATREYCSKIGITKILDQSLDNEDKLEYIKILDQSLDNEDKLEYMKIYYEYYGTPIWLDMESEKQTNE